MLALVDGTVGGLYGIGGGSILAPILIATYQVLQLVHGGAIAPQWILGAFPRRRISWELLRRAAAAATPGDEPGRLLGLIACLIAARYFQTAATTAERGPPAAHVHAH